MKRWNEYHGLTEGEMIEEMVELDALHGWYGTREGYLKRNQEAIRKLWWFSIGVFEFGTEDEVEREMDIQQDRYDV